MESYDHVIHIDESSRELRVYRLDPDGGRSLFISVELPASRGWTTELDAFAKQLGENLLLDSPGARALLDL
jgi:hypothetical protein